MVGSASILVHRSQQIETEFVGSKSNLLWMRIGVKSNLMPLGQHLKVETGEVCRGVPEPSAHSKERNADIFLIENPHDILSKARRSIINAKCERVGPRAPKNQFTSRQLLGYLEVVILDRRRRDSRHDLNAMQRDRLFGVESRERNRHDMVVVNPEMVQRDEQLLLWKCCRRSFFIFIAAVVFGLLLLPTNHMILMFNPALTRALGSHRISRSLDTVRYTREWSTAWVAIGVMLIQRNSELIGPLKLNMQDLIPPRHQTEASVRLELCMKILIRVCRGETHGAGLVFHNQVFAGTMPKAQIIVGWVMECVDDK